ncbi:MAG: hypothetical protein RJB01_176 [Actinomycetota bacterium]
MSDETVEQGALEPMPSVDAADAESKQPRAWLLPVGIGVAGIVLASLTGAAGYALGSERGEAGETITLQAENGEQRMQGPGGMKDFGHDDEFGERGGRGGDGRGGDGRGGDGRGGDGRGGDGRQGNGKGGRMGDRQGDFGLEGGFGPGQGINPPGA